MKKILLQLVIVFLLPLAIGCSKGEIITNANINPVLVSPSKHLEKEVNITAKLLETPNTEKDKSVFYITPDPSNQDLRFKVVYADTAKLNKGEFIRLKGTISDENPTITASKLEKIEPQSVLAPTVKEVELAKKQEQRGFIVTLDKIEFADTETRVFVTVKNETKKTINFYADYAKASQKDKEVSLQKNWEADYTEVPVDIKKDQEKYGIIVFAPLDYEQKKAKLVFEGFSDDAYLKPFEFKVKW